MEFYKRILKTILKSDLYSYDDILINSKASVIAYIIITNKLYDENPIQVGIFQISEKELSSIKSIRISKPTNDDIYDLLLYLDSINELNNYMSLDIKLIPNYDNFYDDLNEKIGLLKDSRKININKICPSCNMIPYYDFNSECDLCKELHVGNYSSNS